MQLFLAILQSFFYSFDLKRVEEKSFEPTTSTIYKWLKTRKAKYTPAGLDFRGLFKTSGYEYTFILVILGIIGELVIVAPRLNNEGLDWTIILTLFFIELAITIIFPHRLLVKEIGLRNQKLLVKTDNEEKIDGKISTCSIYRNSIYLLIFIIAMSKIYFAYIVHGQIDADMVVYIAVYIFSAIIHVSVGAYFVATLIFNININREYLQFVNDPKDERTTTSVEISNPIGIKPLTVGSHSIYIDDEGKMKFKRHGILTDEQLKKIVNHDNIPSDSKPKIAKIALYLQLDSADQTAYLGDFMEKSE